MIPSRHVVCPFTIFLMFVFVALPSSAQNAQSEMPDDDIATVENLLDQQVEAWNRGDIEAFMSAYVTGDALRFASGNTIQRGWDATIERYRRSYPDKTHMGSLRFELFEKRKLSDEWIFVFGRFHLTRDDSVGNLQGLFTLLFEKTEDGWKIVSDHTSSGS